MIAAMWAVFTVLHVLEGHSVHALTTGGEAVALAAISARWGRPSPAFSVHATLTLMLLGLSISALFSGHTASDALWWIALIPALAGFLGGARIAVIWGAISVGALTLVHASPEPPITAEFIASGWQLWVRQAGAAICGALATASVVHTLNRRTEEMAKARELAESAASARAAFLAGISHELRTPLTGMLGMSELLIRGELEPKERAMVEDLHQNSGVLLHLIEQVLDFSRIEARGVEVREAPTWVRTVVEDSVLAAAPAAWQSGLALTFTLSPAADEEVRTDEDLLRQVLTNILSNAVKYTETGGVDVRVGREDGELVIAVTDTGRGMSPSEITEALSPFGRLQHRTTPGTGLGLPISKRLVEALGGGLHIESIAGEGSTFTISIPVQTSPGEQAPSPTTAARIDIEPGNLHDSVRSSLTAAGVGPDLSVSATADSICLTRGDFEAQLRWPARVRTLRRAIGLEQATPMPALRIESQTQRVLVVDDNPTIAHVVSMMVNHAGHEAVVAHSGEAALEQLEEHRFEVVLLDMWMPGLQGPEVATRIAAQWPETRVIAMSASVEVQDRKRWREAGVIEFLDKPVQLVSLERHLARG